MKRLPNALGSLGSPREPGALFKIFLEENFKGAFIRLFQGAKILHVFVISLKGYEQWIFL
jgi:hypothetical protein